MKKAKVVNQAHKQNRILTGKKAVWLTMGAIAVLGTVSVVVPTSNIPGFRYIAEVLGIGADATRKLTMADFAAYAVGAPDNKIASIREANSLSYGGASGTSGGLSPFSTLANDRLAQAYAENAKVAIAMEKSLGGTISPFDKTSLDKQVSFDQALLAKGFDPSKISANSQAARAGAMEALAAAAGQQAEALGKPVKQKDLQGITSLVGVKDSNISNIVGTGNILSLANKEDMLYDRVRQQARALAGTSIFGSVNPEFTRADTRIGRPVYGLFKELGNSYFFSRYAKGAKYATAASDIAVAAFDGGSPQDQSILTQEETAQPGASGNPQMDLNQNAANINACQAMRDSYKQIISSSYQAVENIKDQLRSLSNNRTKTPGFCFGMGSNRNVKIQREQWNNMLSSLESLCNQIRETKNRFNAQCGIVVEQPVKTCEEMKESLILAGVKPKGVLYVKCRDMSVFDKSGEVQFTAKGKRKIRKWSRRFNHYHTSDCDEVCAAEKADSDVPIYDSYIKTNGTLCKYSDECEDYFDARVEDAFAFGNITAMTKLPKK